MRALFRKHDIANVLSPADEAAVKLVQKLKPGEGVTVEVKRVRSLSQLRKWWAFMGLVADAIGTTKEAVSDYALVNTGFVTVHRIGRHTYQHPRSLAFGNMPQAEFNDAYDRAVQFILSEVAPHLKREDLARVEALAA